MLDGWPATHDLGRLAIALHLHNRQHGSAGIGRAGICFSIVNAVLEELIFRGILWEVVSEEWNNAMALGVTALLFGVGHLDGYPPGPLGVILAGLYGITLGGLRWWTGGLALTTACHVGADATIFCILASAGAFDVK